MAPDLDARVGSGGEACVSPEAWRAGGSAPLTPLEADSAVPAAPGPARAMRAYWFLSADIFLGFTAGGAAFPFFSLYARSLGASLDQVALVIGVQSAVGVAAGLLWGRVADRVGRRRPFILGAQAANALLTLAVARAPSWGWLVPLHALLGVAGGAHQVTSLALMGDTVEGHPWRGRLISGYRVGRRPTFVAGLAGFGLVYLLYLLAPPLPGLVATQVLRGVAFAAFTATALTLAIDLAPPEARGQAAGLFGLAQGLAQIGGNWVGGPLAAALGFRSLFALAAGAVLAGAAHCFRVPGHAQPAGRIPRCPRGT
jgi:MFS family permease